MTLTSTASQTGLGIGVAGGRAALQRDVVVERGGVARQQVLLLQRERY